MNTGPNKQTLSRKIIIIFLPISTNMDPDGRGHRYPPGKSQVVFALGSPEKIDPLKISVKKQNKKTLRLFVS